MYFVFKLQKKLIFIEDKKQLFLSSVGKKVGQGIV